MSKSVICPFVLTQYWMDRPTGQTELVKQYRGLRALHDKTVETSQLDNTQCLLPHSQTQRILANDTVR